MALAKQTGKRLRRGIADAHESIDFYGDDAGSMDFERLGRGHRWLDEDAESRRWFAKAAADIERRAQLRVHAWRAAAVNFRRLAGELGDRDAAAAFAEALAFGRGNDLLHECDDSALVLLSGDFDAALAAAESITGDQKAAAAVAALARARRDGELESAERARDIWLEIARADGAGPAEVSGQQVMAPWDWIEECYETIAALGGVRPGSHAEMLDALGVR